LDVFTATLPLRFRGFEYTASQGFMFTNRTVSTLVVCGAGLSANAFFREAFVGSDIDVAIKPISAIPIDGADAE